jgi:serine/threonine protein kinase/tetratricopeptide (TPR) repeat protein
MSPERWQQIEEIFQSALDLPYAERDAYLAEECCNDSTLKVEVDKLLLQFEDASSFIESPVYRESKAGVLSSLMEFDEDDPMLGTLLGSYRIEREIGRGGMGAVYEAIRADGEFRRKAAIKIVKRGMDTDFILKRFRNERQILATLEHPFITRLLDGGTTDDGRPYFLMDFIEGLPLYRFSDKNRLTVNERLNLFTKICEAVEYAHTNLVIHRDLKPSNILVTSDGAPRLLDFGIAKLLNPEMASDTLQPTATAMRMMTIEYASPEQINGEKVTYSTDIYSLGVILFELLTGHRPYRFPNRTPHEIARVICDESPMLPSEAITRSEDTLPIIQVDQEASTIRHLADLRQNSPDNLREMLRGNLDNITLKALCKLPEDRYQSVKQLIEDIEKHLDGKTISTPFYFPVNNTQTPQATKNGRLIAVLPLKLLNFSATENTDESYLSIGLADAIISRLTNVHDFIVRPTSSISGYEKSDTDPMQAGRELGVDFVLDGRIKKFGKKLRVSMQMLDVLKGSNIWAGQFDETFTDVLALEDAISEQVADALVSQITGENNVKLGKRGTDNPQAYEAYLKGRYHWNQFTIDSFPKAIECFQLAVELDPNYALAYVGVADFYIWANIYGLVPSLESYRQAETAVKRALEIDDKLGEAWATFGLVQNNKFDWAEGKRCHQKSIELNPNYPNAHEWYSAHLVGSGNFADGTKEIERAEELDPLSLRTKTLVAWSKYQAHEFDEALAKAEEIIDLDSNFPQGHLQRGYVLIELGRGEEALAEIEKGMTLMPDSNFVKYYHCFALATVNRHEDAKKILAEMKSSKEYVKPMFLGFVSVAAGEIDEAFVYFNQAADEFDPWLVWLGTDAKLEPIRKDKRYLELMRRTKNPMLRQFEEKFSSNTKQSIAVLPLQFISETDKDNAYLAVGLADAMITRLSQIQRIIVRPTNSVLRFAKCEDSFAAGRELDVEYVLSGTIRPAGSRIRISAQLIDIKTNTTLWSDKFDEEFTEVLELEDAVAEKVAKLLIPKLSQEDQQKLAKRSAKNVEAYEAFLRGKYHFFSFTPDDFAKAVSYFEQAVKLDPNYALAYSALSDVFFTLAGFASKSPAENFPLIEKFAQKAIELDDQLGEAYANLGMVKSYNVDFESGEKLLKRGLELNPSQLNGYVWHSVFLTLQGKSDEAIAQARKACDLDPKSGFHQYHYIWTLYHNRRFDEAVKFVQLAEESAPNFAHGQAVAGWVYRFLNDEEKAVKHSEKAHQLSPETGWITANLAATYAKFGNREKAAFLLEEIKNEKNQYVSPYCLAHVFLHLGDKEKTFEMLEKSVADKDVWYPWIANDADLDKLRKERRFVELVEKIQGKSVNQTALIDRETDKIKRIEAEPSFVYRHRYKFIFAGVLILLILIGYATGIITVSFDEAKKGSNIQTVNDK